MPSDILTTLAEPAQRALEEAGIADIEQLGSRTKTEIAALHGIGPSAMKKLEMAMEENGVRFREGV
jgi:hypothetical protein